jgi:hypothetical protein
MPVSKAATDANILQSLSGTVQPITGYSSPIIDGSIDTYNRNNETIKELTSTGNQEVIEAKNKRDIIAGSVGTVLTAIGTATLYFTAPIGATIAVGSMLVLFATSTVSKIFMPRRVDPNAKDMLSAVNAAQKANSSVASQVASSEWDIKQAKIESDTEVAKRAIKSNESILNSFVKTNEFQKLTENREQITDHTDTYSKIASKAQQMAGNVGSIKNLEDVRRQLAKS